jgi:hypothetical protein
MKNRRRSSTLFGSNAGLFGQYVQMLVVGSNSYILFFLAAGESAGADDRFPLVVIAV